MSDFIAELISKHFSNAIMKSPAPRPEDKEGDEMMLLAWGALAAGCILAACKVAGVI